jgi:preprotein translocase subunit SecG
VKKLLLIIVAAAIAVIVVAIIARSGGEEAGASRSPSFKNKVRGIQYVAPTDKPVRRDGQ